MKNLDTTKILKRLIIVSWVALGCCFLIKLLGGNIFEIVCNNQRFITICSYIDNNWFLYYFVMTSYCYLSMYFLVLAMCQRTMYKRWEIITLTITILLVNVVKMFSNPVGIILDIWQGIVMPILFVRKTPKKILNVLLANVLLVAFQLISMFTKNISINIDNGTALESFIFSFDVLLMILLYFGYSVSIAKRKKEKIEKGDN